jgi:uncharacterized protein
VKPDVRFLGVDDSPSTFEATAVRIVGVVTRGAGYVEGVLSDHVAMDGSDATSALERMIRGSRFRPMVRAILLNGVTLGGFNVVDLDALYEALDMPLLSVVRTQPDHEAAAAALRKHFPDAERRLEILARLGPRRFINGRYAVYCNARGLSDEEIRKTLEASTLRGAIPEPIRLAHIIASGIARGHSRGPV